MNMNAIINANIYDFHSYKENQYILYTDEIKEIGNMNEYKGYEDEIDAKNGLIIPGLVNAHTHIYSAFAKGMSFSYNPKSFQDILDQLWWKLDSKLDSEAVYYSGLISAIDFIKNGVTTIIDHHASGKIIKGSLNLLKKSICDEFGMRGIFCFETSDRFDLKECIDENLDFIKNNKSEKLAGLFGMHASLSLSDNSLKIIKEKINDDIPIHIHIAESVMDQLDSLKKSGLKVLERLNSFNLINKNSLLAHCVHVDENELKIIKEKEAKIVVNILSNMNNTVGWPKIENFDKYEIPVLIGNDGLGFNLSRDILSLMFNMKYFMKDPTYFSFEKVIELLKNNYKYASEILGIKIGKIEKGYKSDFLLIPYLASTPMNENNILAHFIYGVLDDFKPSHVIIDGAMIIKNYEYLIDLDMIYDESKKQAKKIWNLIE